MANEGDDNNTGNGSKAEQEFRYTNLVFTDPQKPNTYAHFQRQSTINKTTYTKFINESLKDITATTKKTPKNDALCKMVETQKEYIIKEAKAI